MNSDDLLKLVTREMPFGKYQGRLIADLPPEYLHWFARTGFPPGEIGRLLALMREIDHNGLKPLLTPLRQNRAGAACRLPDGLSEDTHRLPLESPMTVRAYKPETLTPDSVQTLTEPTVLEFGANWCGICKSAQPSIAEAMTDAGAGIVHIKVEDGPGRPLGRAFKVKLWPTLIVLKHGREIGRIVRPTDSESIARLLAGLR